MHELKNGCFACIPLCRQIRWFVLAAVFWLGLCEVASAQQSFSCNGINETITVSMPATATTQRDAPIGTLLTPWITTTAITNYLVCNVQNWGVGPSYRAMLADSGLTVNSPGGITYNVWNTSTPGVGVAIGVQAYVSTGRANCNGWHGWGALTASWNGYLCYVTGSATQINGGFQFQLALVKTGAITSGITVNDTIAETAWVSRATSTSPVTYQTTIHKLITLTPTTINVAACSTPDVTVSMGKQLRSHFTGVGYTTPTVTFTVNINACPAGNLTKIQYQFIPVNAVLDANNGLLALASNATATGIALQLKDGNDAPLKFNTPYTLAGYNSAAGGSYKVPLKAAYRQTAATVTPGSANAALTFTMTYQ